MYCPRCAAQNLDDAKFCRACGADISLVPQAVTGQLAERLAAVEGEEGGRAPRRRRDREPPTIEQAVKSFFTGVAFVFVAFAVLFWAPAGSIWWFWLFIPAFVNIGVGVAHYLRLREERNRLAPPPFAPAQTAFQSAPRASELPPRRTTGELVEPPPSVTEATTRHLGVPVERKPKDAQ